MAGTIKGITIQIGADTTKLSSALNSANRAIKQTQTDLKAVEKALKINPTNINLLKDKQALLNDKIADTKTKLDAMKQAQAQLDTQGVDKNSREYRELKTQIDLCEQELKDLNKESKSFGSAGAQAVAAVGEKLEDVGAKISKVGQDLTTKVTLPLAAVGTVAVTKFAEVDKTMQLTNATMGNTAEQADLLNQAMKDAAANSTFGMNDAATATLNFARAGLSAEQAAAALAPAMNLAAGEGGNLDTVSAGLVATINGFGGSFNDASKYADVFANACNNSALDIDSLSSSMSVAAPIFAAAGYSVNDAALYMGVMANAGIDANTAANALKTGMARLVAPAKEGQEWMDRLGISITNSDGSMKDSVQVQKELHDAFAGLSESEQIAAASAIFGKNQMSNWLALINTAPGDVSALSGALAEEGATAEQAEAMMGGFGGSIEKLKSSIDVAATSLGEALAPTISKVADAIQRAVDRFNSLSDGQKERIAKIGLVVAAIGPLLIIVGKVISLIGTIMTLAPALGAAISVMTGPIGLVIAAIAAVIAIGVALYKNWDTIKAKAEEIGNAIKEKWEGMKQAVSEKVTAMKEAVTEKMEDVKNNVSEKLENVKTFFSTKMATAASTVSTKMVEIKGHFQNKMEDAKTTVSQKLESIKGFFSEKLGSTASTVSSKMQDIKNSFTSKIQDAHDTISGIIEKIKKLFDISLNLDIKLPHISVSGGKAPFGIGGKGSLPSFSVEWYDKGGIFDRPSVIGVGEKRPEFVGALDDLRQIVREESGAGASAQLLSQMVSLMSQLVDQGMKPITVNQTINANETSYAEQQKAAAYEFKQIARALT